MTVVTEARPRAVHAVTPQASAKKGGDALAPSGAEALACARAPEEVAKVFHEVPTATLPQDTSLRDVLASLPREVFEKDPMRAWGGVARVVLCAAVGVLAIAHVPFYLAPLAWLWTGTALAGFFMIAHECGHRSFAASNTVNDVVGNVMMLCCGWTYEFWRLDHNHHHKHTNKLGVDNKWAPVPESEFHADPAFVRFFSRYFRGWAWGLASIVYSLQHSWSVSEFTSASKIARALRLRISLVLQMTFSASLVALLYTRAGWFGLASYGAVWVVYHFWISTFTLVHHCSPGVRWRTEQGGWTAASAQLQGTVHCDYPAIVEWLCLDISWHIPHHLCSSIPWYNLRTAQKALDKHWAGHMYKTRFGLPLMGLLVTECHMFDEATNWKPFPQ